MPSEPSSWTDLIGESVHTSDDQNIGDIEAVSRNFIVVKNVLVNIQRYYIPLHRAEGWDGKVVWLKIAEEAVKTDYESDMAPDRYNYHYSNAPTVDPSNVVRRFQINMPKIPPRDLVERPFVISQETSEHDESVFLCNLCNASLKTKGELSSHVESNHQAPSFSSTREKLMIKESKCSAYWIPATENHRFKVGALKQTEIEIAFISFLSLQDYRVETEKVRLQMSYTCNANYRYFLVLPIPRN